MSHSIYGCWDAYISMVFLRKEAIALWERIESLHDRIEQNPGHRNNEAASQRIESLEQKIVNKQAMFVTHEQHADGYWKGMTKKVREEEGIHDMFGVDPDAPTVLGAWNRRLGDSKGAPQAFRINPVVLQFAPPHVAQAYARRVR